jgi:hypothetical protein
MWIKSSLCKADPDLCVEVYGLDCEYVAVRDSKTPTKVITFTREEWRVFIEGVKRRDFDLKTDPALEQMEQV